MALELQEQRAAQADANLTALAEGNRSWLVRAVFSLFALVVAVFVVVAVLDLAPEERNRNLLHWTFSAVFGLCAGAAGYYFGDRGR